MKRGHKRREEIGGWSKDLFHDKDVRLGRKRLKGHLRALLKHLKDCQVEEGVCSFYVELEPIHRYHGASDPYLSMREAFPNT